MQHPHSQLILQLKKFSQERQWQGYHNPKNLAMALSVETAELLEIFQWLTESQSRNLDTQRLNKVKEEIADVFIYLLQLADQTGIDLIDAAREKIDINEKKYPVDKVQGSAKKYTEYEQS